MITEDARQITMTVNTPRDCPFRVPYYHKYDDGHTEVFRYECNSFECQGITCRDDKFDINCPLPRVEYDDKLTIPEFPLFEPYHKVKYK